MFYVYARQDDGKLRLIRSFCDREVAERYSWRAFRSRGIVIPLADTKPNPLFKVEVEFDCIRGLNMLQAAMIAAEDADQFCYFVDFLERRIGDRSLWTHNNSCEVVLTARGSKLKYGDEGWMLSGYCGHHDVAPYAELLEKGA